MPTDNTNPGNFANRSAGEVKNIARKDLQSSQLLERICQHELRQAGTCSWLLFWSEGSTHNFFIQRDIASQGGHASGGSFEPGDHRAREAGHKGGKSSGMAQPEEWALMLQSNSASVPGIHFQYEVQDFSSRHSLQHDGGSACESSWMWIYQVM